MTLAKTLLAARVAEGRSYRLDGRVAALEAQLTLPTYADNAAAVAGGLAVGKLYKTATGEVRVRV